MPRRTRSSPLLHAALGLATLLPAAGRAEDVTRTFRVVETAGLRRFGYPVHAVLPDGVDGPNFRLTRDGKAVPAQFRRVEVAGRPPRVALDFNINLGPLEAAEFAVEGGKTVSPGPEPRGGLTVEVKDNAFVVANGTQLAYVVPESLDGLFRSVMNVRLEFWKPAGGGLVFATAAEPDRLVRLGDPGRDQPALSGRVSRSGPIAIGLRFEGTIRPAAGASLPTVVELTFPNSKSWGEIRWTVDDPKGEIGTLAADLGLKIEIEPTIVDLGANDTVYGFLRGKERMTLEAAPGTPWLIRKGTADALAAFAKERPDRPAPAEGWTHVFDALRCTAGGVDDFGTTPGARDAIEVDASGRVVFRRQYGKDARPGPKSLTFRLHFVNNPVQIGAVTSPQAMQAPLRVDWSAP